MSFTRLKVQLRRFQLRFRQPLLRFVFCDSRGFFDDGAPVGRLARQDHPDAALLDDRVRIGPEPHSHEKFLHVAQPRSAPIDQVLALARTIQPPPDYHLARLHLRRRFRGALFLGDERSRRALRNNGFYNFWSGGRLGFGLARDNNICRFRFHFRCHYRVCVSALINQHNCIGSTVRCCRCVEICRLNICVIEIRRNNRDSVAARVLLIHSRQNKFAGLGQLRVFESDDHFRHAHRRPLCGTCEDAIGHALRAQGLVALLAQHPRDRVHNIGFAAAIWPDDARQASAAERDMRLFQERFKAQDFYFPQFKQDNPFEFALRAHSRTEMRNPLPRLEEHIDKNLEGRLIVALPPGARMAVRKKNLALRSPRRKQSSQIFRRYI